MNSGVGAWGLGRHIGPWTYMAWRLECVGTCLDISSSLLALQNAHPVEVFYSRRQTLEGVRVKALLYIRAGLRMVVRNSAFREKDDDGNRRSDLVMQVMDHTSVDHVALHVRAAHARSHTGLAHEVIARSCQVLT